MVNIIELNLAHLWLLYIISAALCFAISYHLVDIDEGDNAEAIWYLALGTIPFFNTGAVIFTAMACVIVKLFVGLISLKRYLA
jgi:hypothetical protein